MDDVKRGDQKILEEARKRFAASVSYWSEIYDLCKEDRRFANGNSDNGYQWDARLLQDRRNAAGGARPSLTINKIPQHVAQVTNDQRRNKPQIKVRPVDTDGDDEVAEVLNGMVRHIQRNANDCYEGADIAFSIATEQQVEGGIGYFRVGTDYCRDDSDEQDLYFGAVHDFALIYDDPAIRTVVGRDRRFLFETVMLDEDEFEMQYPDADPIDWSDIGPDTAQWYAKESKQVRVAHYWCVKQERVKGRKRPIQRVMCYTLAGDQILERKEWAGKYIPYCRVVGKMRIVDGKPEISGIVRNAKDAQRLYNYGRSSQAEHIALSPKAPFMADARSVAGYEDQWETANNVPYSVLYFNAYGPNGEQLPMPQRAQGTMPNAAISEMVAIASDDIKATTGQYDASLGQRSNETSGVAIRQRQAEGDMATFHYVDNLAYAIKFAGDILVDLIPKIYDTPRVARILGEDDVADYAEVDPTIAKPVEEYRDPAGKRKKKYNLAAGQYDVAVTVGPGYSTQRQEALEFLQAAGQTAPQIIAATADLLPRLADTPMADEMAKRLRMVLPPEVRQVVEQSADGQGDEMSPEAIAMLNQAKQQMGELAGQLEAMQQALAQAQQEAQTLKTGADLKAAEIQSRERIAAMEAQVNLQIEKMRARVTTQTKRMELSGQDVELSAVEAAIATMTAEVAALQQSQAQIAQAIAVAAAPKSQAVVMTAPSGQVYRAVVDAQDQASAMAAQELAMRTAEDAQRAQAQMVPMVEGQMGVAGDISTAPVQTGVDAALGGIAQEIDAIRAMHGQSARALQQLATPKQREVTMVSPSGQEYRAVVEGGRVSMQTPAGATYVAQVETVQ